MMTALVTGGNIIDLNSTPPVAAKPDFSHKIFLLLGTLLGAFLFVIGTRDILANLTHPRAIPAPRVTTHSLTVTVLDGWTQNGIAYSPLLFTLGLTTLMLISYLFFANGKVNNRYLNRLGILVGAAFFCGMMYALIFTLILTISVSNPINDWGQKHLGLSSLSDTMPDLDTTATQTNTVANDYGKTVTYTVVAKYNHDGSTTYTYTLPKIR